MSKRISSLQILLLLAAMANQPAMLAAGEDGGALCALAALQQSDIVKTGGWPGVGPFKTVNGELVDADKNKLKIETSNNDVTAAELHINVPSGSATNIEMSADFLLESMGAKAARIAEINSQFEKDKLRLPATKMDSPITMSSGKFTVKVHRDDAPVIQNPNDPVKRWPFIIRITGKNGVVEAAAPVSDKPVTAVDTEAVKAMPDKPAATTVPEVTTQPEAPVAPLKPPVKTPVVTAPSTPKPPVVKATPKPPVVAQAKPPVVQPATPVIPVTPVTPATPATPAEPPAVQTPEKIASADVPTLSNPSTSMTEPNSTTPELRPAESTDTNTATTSTSTSTATNQGMQALAPDSASNTATPDDSSKGKKKKPKKDRHGKKPEADSTATNPATPATTTTGWGGNSSTTGGDLTPQPTTTLSSGTDTMASSTTPDQNLAATGSATTDGATSGATKSNKENGWETETEVPVKQPGTEFTMTKPSDLPAVKTSAKTPKLASANTGTKTGSPAVPTTPEAPNPTPTTGSGDSLKDEFKAVLEGWQRIKGVAVKDHNTSELSTFLAGKALIRQQTAIKWLTDQHKYYDMAPKGVDIDKLTPVTANQKYIVAAQVHENSKFMDEATNQVLKETDDAYKVNYTIEKIGGKWFITDSAIITQNQKPTAPTKKH